MRILLLLLVSIAAQAQNQPTSTIPVTTKPLSEVLIERRLTANATVVAVNDSQLSSEITAVVKQIHFDVGDAVKAGETLLSLDATDFKLQLDQAKANSKAAQARLAQAELRLKRANELEQSQYISADDLLGRETDVAVLRADLLRLKVAERSAQRQVEKAQITAPFDGVVTMRQAQQGQLLLPGSAVMQVVQTSNKQIHAKIPSNLAGLLAEADRMAFSQQGQSTAVELIQLSPVLDQQAAIQSARFRPLGDDVLVGQTGQLVWYLSGQLLSADLVVKRDGRLGVFVASNNTARFMPLDNAQEGRPVPISKPQNWQVIIGGRERLQDGQAIQLK